VAIIYVKKQFFIDLIAISYIVKKTIKPISFGLLLVCAKPCKSL